MSILDRVRSGSWLDGQHFAPLDWAVPGLIPEGFGLLTGAPKAGKSWAALGIGLAVASGATALDAIPVGPARPVLLLALEDGDRRLQGRCRSLLGEQTPIPALLDYVTEATPGGCSTSSASGSRSTAAVVPSSSSTPSVGSCRRPWPARLPTNGTTGSGRTSRSSSTSTPAPASW
ncbi:AAA family ATPase [Lapillicoccus sp.]|uniref:AAA family ATPase n=1 Tax=Lapillicoccus sp. TaxID=1909287 RepID=UPI00344D4C16